MIVTVTLNPALDLTYRIDALVPHATHRVATVAERAGGKGLNVARVLHTLGEPVLATGLLGGPTGARVAALLAAEGVAAAFLTITGETRRTVTVVDDHDATGFWEPGPTVPAAEWRRFVGHFQELVGTARVVTLSGSLPPGVPSDAYGVLVRTAAAAGVPAVLDTSGEALRHGLAAGPAMTKPNADELSELLADATPAHIRALTSGAVVVSRGPAGLRAITPDSVHECAPPRPQPGNPTGAGDACVAALARGLRDGTPWPPLLADAVALSAAAVAAPVAGAFDPTVYRRLLTEARLAPTGSRPPLTEPDRGLANTDTDPDNAHDSLTRPGLGLGNTDTDPNNAHDSLTRSGRELREAGAESDNVRVSPTRSSLDLREAAAESDNARVSRTRSSLDLREAAAESDNARIPLAEAGSGLVDVDTGPVDAGMKAGRIDTTGVRCADADR